MLRRCCPPLFDRGELYHRGPNKVEPLWEVHVGDPLRKGGPLPEDVLSGCLIHAPPDDSDEVLCSEPVSSDARVPLQILEDISSAPQDQSGHGLDSRTVPFPARLRVLALELLSDLRQPHIA